MYIACDKTQEKDSDQNKELLMPADKVLGRTFNLVEKSINILDKRHSLIASNIANLDTPGRRAKEINFKEALDDAVNRNSIRMTRTHPHHLDFSNAGSGYEEFGWRHSAVLR